MNPFKQQAMQVALCATWVAGLCLIAFSLYAIQLLPRFVDEVKGKEQGRELKITLFTVPDPFEGAQGERQSLAVRSWLRLSSCLRVVLLGQHLSLHTFASGFPNRVEVESRIDFTFLGVPLFHSMIGRARASTSDIVGLIDSEFVLLPDFIVALEHVHYLEHDWLLIAKSREVPNFPFHLQVLNDLWMEYSGQLVGDEQVQAYVHDQGLWSNCTGKYLWAWNTGEVPLHAGVMPPFVYGQGLHNEWLLNEALSSGLRFVIDASDAIIVFHPSSQITGNSYVGLDSTDAKEMAIFEGEKNAHLASLYGSFYFRPTSFYNTPVKLVPCGNQNLKVFRFVNPVIEFDTSTFLGPIPLLSPQVSAMLQDSLGQQFLNESFLTSFRRFSLARRHIGAIKYPCFSAEVNAKISGHSSFKKRLMVGRLKLSCYCSKDTDERRLDCPVSKLTVPLKPVANLSLPWSLDSLLAKVVNVDNVVVLAVVGNNYRDMLMNWVCRLRHLNISNFIIGAVDTEVYEFALLQGLPVFRCGPGMDLSFNNCHFGTHCFQKVTKLKSRTVLEILQLGYNVLFSDVDVYWFKNPMKYLMSFGPGTLAAQSDQWNETEPSNEPRRLNSGFYFAWSDNLTIAVFKKIVKHAATSHMSEQPSFYDVLCGEFGQYRIGNTYCVEHETNVTVHFLDRFKFPNGAFRGLWEKKNVSKECLHQGCFILHNNWVNGRQKKFIRQFTSGLWDYDMKSRFCLKSWYEPKFSHSY